MGRAGSKQQRRGLHRSACCTWLLCAGLASGLLGAGVGIGVLAGAAASTIFFLRKRRQHQQGGEGLHDLACVQESVIVSKQKKRVGAAPLTTVIVQSGCRRRCLPACLPACVLHACLMRHMHMHVAVCLGLCCDSQLALCLGRPHAGAGVAGDAVPAPSSPRVRVVVFTDGAGGELAGEEDRQRLRAANIQDSVVIIRNRLASGQLSSHQLDSGVDGDHSWSSEGGGSPEPEGRGVCGVLSDASRSDAVQGAAVAVVEAHHPGVRVGAPEQLQHSASKRVQFCEAAAGAIPAVSLEHP